MYSVAAMAAENLDENVPSGYNPPLNLLRNLLSESHKTRRKKKELECGPMPNVMAALGQLERPKMYK